MSTHRRLCRVLAVAALSALAAPMLLAAAAPLASAGADEPLQVIGRLPEPPGRTNSNSTVVGTDGGRRRLYYSYMDVNNDYRIATYDLKPRIPKLIATGRLTRQTNSTEPTPLRVAVDTKRQRIAFLTINPEAASVPVGDPSVTIYSDVSHSVVGRWELPAIVPGFYPMGATYSAADDRFYFVGEFSGVQHAAGTELTSKPAGSAPSVVALSADGNLLWTRTIPQCQQPLYAKGFGSLIARSTAAPALYFACVNSSSVSGQAYPTESGVVRLTIDPKATDSVTAARLPLDYFPISGSYYAGGSGSGIAAFDHTTDRFYLQSLAFTTPGAWVLDGRLNAWVGFVPARNASDFYVGINETLSHLYIGTRSGGAAPPTDGLNVTNVCRSANVGDFVGSIVTSAQIVGDNGSRRLFVRPYDPNQSYLVLEDTTPRECGNQDVDWDSLTSNTADTPDADTSFDLGTFGYGAQAIQVGGTGAPLTALGAVGNNGIPGVASGTRAVMTSRGQLNLSQSGSSATAQAANADGNTVTSYEENSKDKPVQDGGKWPYPVQTCLDTGNDPKDETYPTGQSATGPAANGSATITCQIAKNVARASSTMRSFSTGAAVVGGSSYQATAARDTKIGGAVTSKATANGVTFAVPGGITVELGHVMATATATAHGRPGTTTATYDREISGIKVTNGSTVLYTSPGCATHVEKGTGKSGESPNSCAAIEEQINSLLPMRFHIAFPVPNVIATPGGAYATVSQTDGQYFQQRTVNDQGVIYRGDSVGPRPIPAVVTEVLADTNERSRTVTVLAATQADAIFTVVPPYKYGDVPPDAPPPVDSGPPTFPIPAPPVIAPGGTMPDALPQVSPTQTVAATPVTQLSGYFFLRRGLRDTILLVLLAGLMSAGVGTALRRRRLVDVLVTVPGKDLA